MTAFYARRSVLTGLACATLVVAARPSVARALPKVVVTKDRPAAAAEVGSTTCANPASWQTSSRAPT